jgi:type I restriction enzyme S subunit
MTMWPEVPLGDVTDISSGITKGRKVPSGVVRSVPYMSVANVQSMRLDLSVVKEIDVSEAEIERFKLRKHDLLLTEGGDPDKLGRGTLWGDELPECIHQNHIFRVRAGSEVDPGYLKWAVASEQGRGYFLRSAKQTTGIASINMTQLRRFPLPLPPLAEQRKIAEVLDEVGELRIKRRMAILLLKDLAESIFLDMFGDPVTNPRGWMRNRLEETIIVGPQNGLYQHASSYGSGTPIVRIDAFYDGVITGIGSLKRLEATQETIKKYELHRGDILVNRVNSREYLGKSALVPELSEPTLFESNMMRMRIDQARASSQYVVWFMQTAFVKGQIAVAAKDAVNQSSINQTDVRRIIINLPPIALQEEFVNRICAVEAEKAKQRQHLAMLDELSTSVQSRAFQGTLFV